MRKCRLRSTRSTSSRPSSIAAAGRGRDDGDGPLLIIAGAGTGKTRTLVYRVAHLIERGVRAERILLLTFTRRAAHEMLTRAERLVGGRERAGARRHLPRDRHIACSATSDQRPGLPRDFSIMDQGDAEDLMQLARAELGFGKQEKRFPKKETLHYVYSRHINTEIAVEDIARRELSAVRRVHATTSFGSSPTTPAESRSAISSTTTTCCSSGR